MRYGPLSELIFVFLVIIPTNCRVALFLYQQIRCAVLSPSCTPLIPQSANLSYNCTQCCHFVSTSFPYNKNEKSLHFPTQSETKNAIIFSYNTWPCNTTYYIRCMIKSARSVLLYMRKTSIITLTESTTA